jgi:hypothetical protein
MLILSVPANQASADQQLNEADAIETWMPAYSQGWGTSADKEVATYSPDCGHFAVVIRRGDIATNTNVYRLLVWSSAAVRQQEPSYSAALDIRSSRNAPAVHQLVWSHDSTSIWFIGEAQNHTQQVFRYNLGTGHLDQITAHPTDILAFGLSADESEIAFTALNPPKPLWTDQTKNFGLVASEQPTLKFTDFVRGDYDAGEAFDRAEAATASLFIQSPAGVRPLPTIGELTTWDAAPPIVSPAGERVAVRTRVRFSELPREFLSASDQNQVIGRHEEENGRGAQSSSYLMGYEVVETASAKPLRVPPTRAGLFPEGAAAIRFNDSDRVSIEGSFVRLGAASGSVRATEGTLSPTVVPLASETNEGFVSLVEQHFHSNRQASSSGPQCHGTVPVTYSQSAAVPPVLTAHLAGGRHLAILDLDPQLRNRSLGAVKSIEIRSRDDKFIHAGLFLPPQYVKNHRYPLVIQGHGWNPNEFQMDGFTTTGYAARALAARDIVVLQLDDTSLSPSHTADGVTRLEYQSALELFQASIRILSERGIIDPARVGYLGWSHTCDYMTWALTNDPNLFAAAVCAGESTSGYFSYLSRLGGVQASSVRGLFSGPPFGSDLDSWRTLAPSFNLAAVKTPVRLIALSSPLYLPMEWEWYEGLNLLGRPVELTMFQRAQHILIRPSERLSVSGGNVDWFDFWLNGHESADPTKREQYIRWKKLCDLQKSENPSRPTFCDPSKSN